MIGENAMKDSELIQKVHSGNKEAVGIIIERYYADIYRFCPTGITLYLFPIKSYKNKHGISFSNIL